MSDPSIEAPYTLRSIEKMLGLTRTVVSTLIEAGFVTPSRGARNEYRFSFQDVVLLRTAHELKTARIPPRRMIRSLQQLKSKLPAEMPISGLRIKAIGGDIAVRNADAQWEASTGQLLMDFEVSGGQGSVAFITRSPTLREPEATSADGWFERAQQLEDAADPAGATEAYRRALALAPNHVHAALNLGALLCEGGHCDAAVALYDDALRHSPAAPQLHFNRAIALEDQHREAEALRAYEACLELDPKLADAHFNAARLHEMLGHPQRALRHFSEYRRLSAGGSR